MRRTVIAAFAVATLAVASSVDAQTIGFKLGASFANWNVEDDGQDVGTNQGTLSSFMGGGFIRFGLGRLGLQPELLVVTRGTEIEGAGDDDMAFKVDYVEVPVLLVLPLTMNTGFAPYVFGGPSFAFEIGCRTETNIGDTEVDEEDCDSPGADLFERKKTDIGVTAGAGLEFPLGPGALLIEGRYNWGLSNLADETGLSVKSRTGAVLAGYSIWIGSR